MRQITHRSVAVRVYCKDAVLTGIAQRWGDRKVADACLKRAEEFCEVKIKADMGAKWNDGLSTIGQCKNHAPRALLAQLTCISRPGSVEVGCQRAAIGRTLWA